MCVKCIVSIEIWNCHWCYPNGNVPTSDCWTFVAFFSFCVSSSLSFWVSVLVWPGSVRIRRKQIKQHDTEFETVSCVTVGDVHHFQYIHRFACKFSSKHKYLNRKTNSRINFEIKFVHRWSLMNRIVPIEWKDWKKNAREQTNESTLPQRIDKIWKKKNI